MNKADKLILDVFDSISSFTEYKEDMEGFDEQFIDLLEEFNRPNSDLNRELLPNFFVEEKLRTPKINIYSEEINEISRKFIEFIANDLPKQKDGFNTIVSFFDKENLDTIKGETFKKVQKAYGKSKTPEEIQSAVDKMMNELYAGGNSSYQALLKHLKKIDDVEYSDVLNYSKDNEKQLKVVNDKLNKLLKEATNNDLKNIVKESLAIVNQELRTVDNNKDSIDVDSNNEDVTLKNLYAILIKEQVLKHIYAVMKKANGNLNKSLESVLEEFGEHQSNMDRTMQIDVSKKYTVLYFTLLSIILMSSLLINIDKDVEQKNINEDYIYNELFFKPIKFSKMLFIKALYIGSFDKLLESYQNFRITVEKNLINLPYDMEALSEIMRSVNPNIPQIESREIETLVKNGVDQKKLVMAKTMLFKTLMNTGNNVKIIRGIFNSQQVKKSMGASLGSMAGKGLNTLIGKKGVNTSSEPMNGEELDV